MRHGALRSVVPVSSSDNVLEDCGATNEDVENVLIALTSLGGITDE
jgi:hypothetical protein